MSKFEENLSRFHKIMSQPLSHDLMRSPGFQFGLIIVGIFIIIFASSQVYTRAKIELIGKVITATKNYGMSGIHKSTTYVVEGIDGGKKVKYVAGCNSTDLDSDIPVGARISKKKWELSYMINEGEMDDNPKNTYSIMSFVGVMLIVTGVIKFRRSWKIIKILENI